MNEQLDLPVRKKNGRSKIDSYKSFFKGFNLKKTSYIELKKSDEVLLNIKNVFSNVVKEYEIVRGSADLKDSNLLFEIFNLSKKEDFSYIFTDEVDICGMFKVTTKSALKSFFVIAFLADQKTCFLTDCEFKFSFTIKYCDLEHNNLSNEIDIQRYRLA